VLRGPWVDDWKRKAAAKFLEYLEAPEQQERFRAEGYRDHEGRGGSDLIRQWGTLPDGLKKVLPAPAAEALAAVEDSWKDVRKRARVLMVLDTSGSMQGVKIDLMRRGAAAALGLFLDDDEVGVWGFETERYDVSPMGPVGANRAGLADAILRLKSDGGTKLYDTTYAAVRALAANPDPRRITAVVVLTDGVNTHGNNDVNLFIREIGALSTSSHVRVFTIAYGTDADKTVLQSIADVTQGAAYDASDPASIKTVFQEVISNF
jgi:Ca-activated chloride channel family protein